MDLGIESPTPLPQGQVSCGLWGHWEDRGHKPLEVCVCECECVSAQTRAHEGVISEVMAHDLRCTMPPLRASRPLACLPKGSLSQRPKCPPPLHLTPKFSCPLRAEEGGTKGKGVPCTYLSPLPQISPDLLYIFTGVPLPTVPFLVN